LKCFDCSGAQGMTFLAGQFKVTIFTTFFHNFHTLLFAVTPKD
jgi:hypothetical protein